MTVELRITMKDEERKLTKDFNIYDKITMDVEDPVIANCIKEAKAEFKGIPDDIKVKLTMVVL